MGQSIVDVVVQGLKAAGYRAQTAYPGQRMPALEDLAVAVQLKEADQKAATATVLVSVLVPVSMGGAACESKALEVCHVLREMAATYTLGKIEYFSDMELFCVKITAQFCGTHTEDGWQAFVPEQGFTVMIGDVVLPYVRTFQAYRDGLEEGLEVAGLPWRFRMEEVFPLDVVESPQPTGQFELVVIRKNRRETYNGCILQFQQRTLKSDGQHQQWEGFCWSCSYT